VIAAAGGSRTVSLSDWYVLPSRDPHQEVALASNELVTEVLIPTPVPGSRGTYRKVAEHGAHDFALLSVAAQLAFSGDTVRSARIALGGVAPVPWRAREAETALEGNSLTEDRIARAAQVATIGARPLAQNGYKIDLAQALVRQALGELG
jgi:xanthine dehydrogenase YagS FAD-binding subunit